MKITIVFILMVLTFAGCKSKDAVLLRLKYLRGEEKDYTIGVKCACGTSLHVNTSMTATFTVDSVTRNNEFPVISKISAIKTDIDLGFLAADSSENYDSEKGYADMDDNERALDAKYSTIMANYYCLTFNNRGQVVKPFTSNGKPVSAPYGAEFVQLSFPEKKVKVGDSWTVSVLNPLANSTTKLFASNCVFTYTINDITADKVMIDVAVDIQPEGLMAKLSNGFKGSGKYTINRADGCVEDGYIKIPQQNCDDALISITAK